MFSQYVHHISSDINTELPSCCIISTKIIVFQYFLKIQWWSNTSRQYGRGQLLQTIWSWVITNMVMGHYLRQYGRGPLLSDNIVVGHYLRHMVMGHYSRQYGRDTVLLDYRFAPLRLNIRVITKRIFGFNGS